ncbi:hypothetical protein [Nocardiopsis sp. CA-288880]|uniref:hypothetical protein n=1 Tax=Nocardiopsis sp. CA-288880 TaxID=3239995 RepID=UPI003D99784E
MLDRLTPARFVALYELDAVPGILDLRDIPPDRWPPDALREAGWSAEPGACRCVHVRAPGQGGARAAVPGTVEVVVPRGDAATQVGSACPTSE